MLKWNHIHVRNVFARRLNPWQKTNTTRLFCKRSKHEEFRRHPLTSKSLTSSDGTRSCRRTFKYVWAASSSERNKTEDIEIEDFFFQAFSGKGYSCDPLLSSHCVCFLLLGTLSSTETYEKHLTTKCHPTKTALNTSGANRANTQRPSYCFLSQLKNFKSSKPSYSMLWKEIQHCLSVFERNTVKWQIFLHTTNFRKFRKLGKFTKIRLY